MPCIIYRTVYPPYTNRFVQQILSGVKIQLIQNGETERKRQQELDQQRVASQMAELQMAKRELEQEVDTHKTRLRLHMEAQVRTQNNTWECLTSL